MKTFDSGMEAWKCEGMDSGRASMPPVVQAHRRQGKAALLKGGLQALMLALVVGGLLTGCAFYGFSGASIPSHLNTIAIPIAADNTASPIPTLGRDLTNRLSDRFTGRTRLSLNNNESEADAVLTAQIQQYENTPTGVSGEERATSNEVRIEVDVRYYDQVRDSTMLEQSFTGTTTYDPTQGLGREEEAARTALEDVADDIFTTATSDW